MLWSMRPQRFDFGSTVFGFSDPTGYRLQWKIPCIFTVFQTLQRSLFCLILLFLRHGSWAVIVRLSGQHGPGREEWSYRTGCWKALSLGWASLDGVPKWWRLSGAQGNVWSFRKSGTVSVLFMCCPQCLEHCGIRQAPQRGGSVSLSLGI